MGTSFKAPFKTYRKWNFYSIGIPCLLLHVGFSDKRFNITHGKEKKKVILFILIQDRKNKKKAPKIPVAEQILSKHELASYHPQAIDICSMINFFLSV